MFMLFSPKDSQLCILEPLFILLLQIFPNLLSDGSLGLLYLKYLPQFNFVPSLQWFGNLLLFDVQGAWLCLLHYFCASGNIQTQLRLFLVLENLSLIRCTSLPGILHVHDVWFRHSHSNNDLEREVSIWVVDHPCGFSGHQLLCKVVPHRLPVELYLAVDIHLWMSMSCHSYRWVLSRGFQLHLLISIHLTCKLDLVPALRLISLWISIVFE
jgi:hypothetical protein